MFESLWNSIRKPVAEVLLCLVGGQPENQGVNEAFHFISLSPSLPPSLSLSLWVLWPFETFGAFGGFNMHATSQSSCVIQQLIALGQRGMFTGMRHKFLISIPNCSASRLESMLPGSHLGCGFQLKGRGTKLVFQNRNKTVFVSLCSSITQQHLIDSTATEINLHLPSC